VTLKTVGGYEVFEDADSGESVKIHQLQACIRYEPSVVFNSRYYNIHHRNTIGWDNRLENLLLFRARYHRNFHDNADWSELVKYYGEVDVSKRERRRNEKYYRTLTENHIEEWN
jgi:hypothetical protein